MNSQTETPSGICGSLHEEGGWTLVELLVGLVLMMAIVFAALPIVEGAFSTEGRIQTAAESIGEARTFADLVLRDLRPADDVAGNYTASQITVDTWVRHLQCGDFTAPAPDASPIQCQVTYRCSGTSPNVTCTRQEENGPVVTEISGLDDSNIFSYYAPGDTPLFVGITLKLPNQQNSDSQNANGAIQLHDGTALRNLTG